MIDIVVIFLPIPGACRQETRSLEMRTGLARECEPLRCVSGLRLDCDFEIYRTGAALLADRTG